MNNRTKRKLLGIAALLLTCQAHPARAEDIGDSRIKLLLYREDDVYTIVTRYGYQTNIVFGPNEEVQTISVGDRSLWQIIPAGHRLFIRPMEEGASTNMTIITNRHSYQFDIKSLKENAKVDDNIYVAQFVYSKNNEGLVPLTSLHAAAAPAIPAAASTAPAAAPAPEHPLAAQPPMAMAQPAAAAAHPPEASPNAGTPNYDYTFSGPDELAPLKVYDNGYATFFKYRDTTQPFPNIYTIDRSGKETLLTPYRADGYMAVDAVAGEFALKSSAGTIHVYNEVLNPPK